MATIFNLIEDLTYKKVRWENQSESNQKIFSPYMTNRILSMNSDYIDMVNDIQQITLSPEQLYNVYFSFLPKQKSYSKYISTKVTRNEKLLRFFADQLETSTDEVEYLITKLSKQQIIEFVRLYGLDAKKEFNL